MDDRLGNAERTEEIEKPFKCGICNSRFTNEDHLQVHKRRHEMSLSFARTGPLSLGQEGFVDETPTPSRFIRNCEEVGLFQDLNPFDEQFSKATTSTPTSENNFGFNFSHKPVSSDDTLNTPQVFGYHSHADTENLPAVTRNGNSGHKEVVQVGNAHNIHTKVSNLQEPQKDRNESISQSHNSFCIVEEMSEEKMSAADEIGASVPEMVPHSTHEVEVNSTVLSPNDDLIELRNTTSLSSADKSDSITKPRKLQSTLRLNIEPSQECALSSGEVKHRSTTESEKKSEILERNRAAASRSRQRRKQWISSLEGKCEGLQSDVARLNAELAKVRTENKILRLELSKHANCNVTLSQSPTRNKPTILRQASHPSPSVLHSRTPTPESPVHQFVASPIVNTVKVFQVPSQSQIPKQPAKRGRPRKGLEKRASIVSDIPILKNTEALKVQILPLFSGQNSNTPQKVFILKS